MIALLWAAIIVLIILSILGGLYLFRRGYGAGQREQRQVINRAVDRLRQQSAAAQRNVDYLYSQATRHISEGASDGRRRPE